MNNFNILSISAELSRIKKELTKILKAFESS